MDMKIDIKDFPSLNDVCIVPKKTLEELIDYYKSNEVINSHIKNADKIKNGEIKGYTHEELMEILEKGNKGL